MLSNDKMEWIAVAKEWIAVAKEWIAVAKMFSNFKTIQRSRHSSKCLLLL
jgi:hypothetical protein